MINETVVVVVIKVMTDDDDWWHDDDSISDDSLNNMEIDIKLNITYQVKTAICK